MENKKFNKEIYEGIKKGGNYKDQYYNYILINKNQVFKGWASNWLTSQKYEFFGIMDKNKKDVISTDNIETVQKETIQEAIEEITSDILKNEDYFLNIQKEAFYKRISTEEAKRGILYNSGKLERFPEYYVIGTTPEELKKELCSYLIRAKERYFTSEAYFTKYTTQAAEEIKKEIKETIQDDRSVDEWDFNYNWNNGTPDSEKIACTFKNYVSLLLNKYNFIVSEYKKLYEAPSEQLKKSKKLFNLCEEFYKINNNKSCFIYLKDGSKLKAIDFDYLIYILKSGREKGITYQLFTGSDRNILEKYNETAHQKTREDDLFVEDIQKIEFNKKIIYEEA